MTAGGTYGPTHKPPADSWLKHVDAYGHLPAQYWPRVYSSLRAKTPVPGLYLTGQDVGSAGITGAMMGGMLAAAALEPKLVARIA